MPALTTARILTVEDDPIVRVDLRLILEDAGYEVCPDARDGVEAVDLAREHQPDLILIDLGLPRLDGVEATRLILDERDVPIVALTGHANGDCVDRAVEAGAVGHVLKPFSEAQLVETLAGVLTHRAERDEWERRSQLIMIESMLRAGHSEREIASALREAAGEPPTTETVRSLAGRFRAFLGSAF
jgi:two-component system, response regulator PdtaR